jgi:hypothetical protein
MTMLHVVPDERSRWRVFEDASRVPLSEHTSATAAELAAWRHARLRGADSIVLHDRYWRTHRVPRFERAAPAARG